MTKAHIYAAPLLGLATLAALGLTARPAAAQTTINFDTLNAAIVSSGGGSAPIGQFYDTQGFTFTASNIDNSNLLAISASGILGDGETSLYGNYNGNTSLTQDNGQTFSLTAIDLGPLGGNSNNDGSVIFTGTKANGATVTDTVTMTSTRFQPFTSTNLSNLTDLQSLTFVGTSNSIGYTSLPIFDNVVLTPTASPAPEPSQMAGLGLTVLGLGGLLLRARKRKAQEPLSA